VLNATFNNISIISWQSALLIEKSGILFRKPPTVTDKLYHIMFVKMGSFIQNVGVNKN